MSIYTRTVCHFNDKQLNAVRQFPGDFASYQQISMVSTKKSSRVPEFPGVLGTPCKCTYNIWHHYRSLCQFHCSDSSAVCWCRVPPWPRHSLDSWPQQKR